jgi:hypothetical protein
MTFNTLMVISIEPNSFIQLQYRHGPPIMAQAQVLNFLQGGRFSKFKN